MSCKAVLLGPGTIGAFFLTQWRNDEKINKDGHVDKKESCGYKVLKRAVALPAGFLLSTIAIVEGVVKSIFALLLSPLACFNASKGFYNEYVVMPTTVSAIIGIMGIISSFSQIATTNFMFSDFFERNM